MKKYYIYHARGIFDETTAYAEKSQTEMLEDILASYPAFVQLASFDSKAEAEKEYSKYDNDISIWKNSDGVIINYNIYTLKEECAYRETMEN